MTIRVTWLPNPEADIDYYEVWESTNDQSYILGATIDHNLGDPLVYDSSTGRFFWEDADGLTTYYYKVKAFDTAANESSFTVAKQAGPSTPPLCVLYGTVLYADGQPQTEAQVQIFIKSTEPNKEGQFVNTDGIVTTPIQVFTDDAGYWEANVVRQAVVRVVIPPINLDVEIDVPDAASAEITTLT